MTNSINFIQKAIEKGDQVSPFLFLSNDIQAIHQEIQRITTWLQKIYRFPVTSIFDLDTWSETIKIQDVRKFIENSHVKSSYNIQVFTIYNISQLTLWSSNGLLKFLEEPWPWNIIFLTNTSESGILDTVLSRVQVHYIESNIKIRYSEEIVDLLEKFINQNNVDILQYYYSKKIQKEDGIIFLYSLIDCISKTGKHIEILSDIEESINGLAHNNFVAKFIIDQYLIQLKK